MANTPNRVIRVEAPLWEAYGQVCAAKGIKRSDDLRAYMQRAIRQFTREGGRITVDTGGNQATHNESSSPT
ncbi:hypothetical protein K1W54_04990 [Micromonospora sp. CPCC 205371]|nr:hypothetical protein [Micromonospora sp. CPCC 205371]